MCDWDKIWLSKGSHGKEWHGSQNAIELSNLIAAGKVVPPPGLLQREVDPPFYFDDYHSSISSIIRVFVLVLNDFLDDEPRQLLKPYAARILGTAAGPKTEEKRAWLVIDWIVRTHVPALLRLTGLEDHARTLESLTRIEGPESARNALPPLNEAHEASYPDPYAGLWGDEPRIAAYLATRYATSTSTWAAEKPWDAWRAVHWVADRVARQIVEDGDPALQASTFELLDALLAVPVID